jgi:hypothetical protein
MGYDWPEQFIAIEGAKHINQNPFIAVDSQHVCISINREGKKEMLWSEFSSYDSDPKHDETLCVHAIDFLEIPNYIPHFEHSPVMDFIDIYTDTKSEMEKKR